jgi:hypothetical protein
VITGITGCYQSSAVIQLFIPFILLLGLEFGASPGESTQTCAD